MSLFSRPKYKVKKVTERPPVPRLAVRRQDIPAMLGISGDTFDRYVKDSLPRIELGKAVIYPITGVEFWLRQRETLWAEQREMADES